MNGLGIPFVANIVASKVCYHTIFSFTMGTAR